VPVHSLVQASLQAGHLTAASSSSPTGSPAFLTLPPQESTAASTMATAPFTTECALPGPAGCSWRLWGEHGVPHSACHAGKAATGAPAAGTAVGHPCTLCNAVRGGHAQSEGQVPQGTGHATANVDAPGNAAGSSYNTPQTPQDVVAHLALAGLGKGSTQDAPHEPRFNTVKQLRGPEYQTP
jgi:hypothetical protein